MHKLAMQLTMPFADIAIRADLSEQVVRGALVSWQQFGVFTFNDSLIKLLIPPPP